MQLLNITIISVCILLIGCASKKRPYENGPVMSQKSIQKTFKPILDFMDAKPGLTFADVGAGSGALTVMMSTLMDSTIVYIQDIDSATLNQDNLNKIINHYSTNQSLRDRNGYFIVIGDAEHSKLPEQSLDLIYTNGTMHVFDSPDSMIADLRKKLKPTGKIFIRDSFKNDHGAKDRCKDPTCGKRLITIDEFLEIMKRNGFMLKKQAPDMSGYPVFGFQLDTSSQL